jgi:hypothetical protein
MSFRKNFKNDEKEMNRIPATISVKKRFIYTYDELFTSKDGTKIHKMYLHDIQMD